MRAMSVVLMVKQRHEEQLVPLVQQVPLVRPVLVSVLQILIGLTKLVRMERVILVTPVISQQVSG
jgi:hypothetical protein